MEYNRVQYRTAIILLALGLPGCLLPGIVEPDRKPQRESSLTASLSEWVYGVTVDDISDLPAIEESLSRLSKRATVRIVFDEGMNASYYRDAVNRIGAVAGIMGEILDSYYVKNLSIAQYLQRTEAYLDAFDTRILWEVGNETNGEWLGRTSDVVAKVHGAFKRVKSRGGKTALTLYYNEGCWSKPENEMFRWAQTNLPTEMKSGLDYVWISYYEEDCNHLRPDWDEVFARLSAMFPHARIGFGEVGDRDGVDKEDVLRRFYTTPISAPRYVGGHFWWYYRQDMVPYTQPLWSTLDDMFQVLPKIAR